MLGHRIISGHLPKQHDESKIIQRKVTELLVQREFNKTATGYKIKMIYYTDVI